MFASLKLNRLYNLKLPVFKFSGKRTYHSGKFAWYVEKNSAVDVSPKSYHLTAFEMINQLPYINFPSFECRFFKKDLKSTLSSSVAL